MLRDFSILDKLNVKFWHIYDTSSTFMWKNWRRHKEQGPLGLSIGFYVVKFILCLLELNFCLSKTAERHKITLLERSVCQTQFSKKSGCHWPCCK